ncbi:hypothetical protein VSR17_10965 [Cupriavidus taiwanensis]|uniref:hypothetical protein n=1 Tax=Cupriavidus taiwanensis TaxID=164546 RepID=UPI000E148F3D|nr:hypothetical protein [Cupriavidus taiwanensis]SOZ28060.1 conserved exported hypothetical protein [Cupriavidus taiwanensis]SPA32312.1 conserved exported hypothetical protein [Cupriavidus taiwanensis]
MPAINVVFTLLVALAALLPAHAATAELALPGYQRSDGAITTYLGGDSIDPYFAAKALLAAQDAGMITGTAARNWIAWQLPRQHVDGRFDRYCLKGQHFAACQAADADDALMAAWMELLVRTAPAKGMPPAWQASFDTAARYLDTLRDGRTGVYHISRTLPVALLMDNVEVSSAFKAASRYRQSLGDSRGAAAWARQAEQLDQAILRVFWRNGVFLVSTQPRERSEFYPDAVAQIFPILADIQAPGRPHDSAYRAWMTTYRFAWLQMSEVDFPWGLVALVADKMGDADAITCWRVRSNQFRHGHHWNVLEEALFLAFEARLAPAQALAPPAPSLRCR